MIKKREERIAYAIKVSGKKKKAIAEECNSSQASFSGWIKRGAIPAGKLPLFSRTTGFNMQWILEGKGPMRAGEKNPRAPILGNQEIAAFVETRQYDTAGREYIDLPPQYANKAVHFYATAIHDDAMAEELRQGEIVVVDANHLTQPSQNGVFLIEKTGECVIRKYRNTGIRRALIPLGDLEQYPSISITKRNPVKSCGTIVYKLKFYHD